MDNSSAIFHTDCDSIVSQITNQEEQLRLKRRWLLGCEISESEHQTPGRTNFLKAEFLPESLLREDDIFHETIKSRVEEAFGLHRNEELRNVKDSMVCTLDVIRMLDTNLDSLTNTGLYLVAMIVTENSSSFEKTRLKMKEIIKESLNRDFRKKDEDSGKTDAVKQLYEVLTNPGNFQLDYMMNLTASTFQSRRDCVIKVLNELDDLSMQTLLAMKRKLKGLRSVPRLKTSRCGQSRSNLIDQVRQASETMLSELSEGEDLQEPLAKAMVLVQLSGKVSPGYKTNTVVEFFKFSPEIKNLQNEIVKAIWLLRKKVRFRELKKLQNLLDPEANISNDSLRSAVRKMLIEYLFECGDMDTIPESLLKALSLINRSTRSVEHKLFPKEAIEEEVECILDVSAQVKQLFWQWLPNYELDQDFNDAYMEELEDSEDENSENEESVNIESRCENLKLEARDSQYDAMDDSIDSDHEESGAECSILDPAASTYEEINQNCFSSPVNRIVIRDITESITRLNPRSLYVTPTSNKSTLHNIDMSKIKVKVERDIEMAVDNQFSSRSVYSVQNIKTDHDMEKLSKKKNQYLAIQEVSDETSLVAYNLIGRLLEKFADGKGLELDKDERSYLNESRPQEDIEVSEEKQASSQEKSDVSIIAGVVKELLPSIEQSVLMRFQELMDVS